MPRLELHRLRLAMAQVQAFLESFQVQDESQAPRGGSQFFLAAPGIHGVWCRGWVLHENGDACSAFAGFSEASHIAGKMFLKMGDDEESPRRGTPGSGAGAVSSWTHRVVVGRSGCGAVWSAIPSSPRCSLQSVWEVAERLGEAG